MVTMIYTGKLLMTKAVYAGSFDPVTNGHLWIIKEASLLFEEVIVAIGDNSEKKCSFSLDDRLSFLKDATSSIPNITITSFKNEFLVHYATKQTAKYIIRGIRNSADYEYEKSMRYINNDLNSNISTIFLIPPRDYAELSSSMIKGLVGADGWEAIVNKYVPYTVLTKLIKQYNARRLNHQ